MDMSDLTMKSASAVSSSKSSFWLSAKSWWAFVNRAFWSAETRLELEEENFLFKTSKPATDTGIQNMSCWYVYSFFLCGFLSRSFGAQTKTRDKCVQLRTASFGGKNSGEKAPELSHGNRRVWQGFFPEKSRQNRLFPVTKEAVRLANGANFVASERLLNSWAVVKRLIPGSQPQFSKMVVPFRRW